MTYSYDRTASGAKWYDIVAEAEENYIEETAKNLAQMLRKGSFKMGGFASAEVTSPNFNLKIGFVGGGGGTIYVLRHNKQKEFGPGSAREEFSVVNHTPQSFAAFLFRTFLG